MIHISSLNISARRLREKDDTHAEQPSRQCMGTLFSLSCVGEAVVGDAIQVGVGDLVLLAPCRERRRD